MLSNKVEDPAADEFLADDADCSRTELKLTEWDVICEDGDFAYLKKKADATIRRCACTKNGKYFWTYGSKCDGRLPCYP